MISGNSGNPSFSQSQWKGNQEKKARTDKCCKRGEQNHFWKTAASLTHNGVNDGYTDQRIIKGMN